MYSIAGRAVNGGDGPDSLVGTSGNDTVNGGAGPDTYALSGTRSQYVLSNTGHGYQVQDTHSGRDGTETIAAVEMLIFSDSTVDLTMVQKAAALGANDLKTLEELYVGFFNRVPEAAGLRHWMGQVESGAKLRDVADQFYSAGVLFGVFSEDMTEAEFITVIYANVLGRTGATAPNSQEIGYWQEWLHTRTNSKGAMVLEMLSNSHTGFTGHPEFGWVVSLLDNKAVVANYFAVQQGLSYTEPQANIARGIEVAAAITPVDTSAAIALIGVNEFSM
jgi:serralysin